MNSKQRCIECNSEAGTKWTSYWCEDCDAIRRARIGAALTEMLAAAAVFRAAVAYTAAVDAEKEQK